MFHSPNHLNLTDARSPKTKTCIRAFREKTKRKTDNECQEKEKKPKK